MRHKKALPSLLAFILLAVLTGSHAQELNYLAIQGDGTASVAVDEGSKVAYITDGGRSGKSGIRSATISGSSVLDYLRSKVETIVFTCSHPHADHMGGLEDLVRTNGINEFQLAFIDNGQLRHSGKQSLHEIYLERWGDDPRSKDAQYELADNADAFENVDVRFGDMSVSNYVYAASEVGSGDHDSAVIVQYNLGHGISSRRVVDFDDASTALVRHWAERQEARVNTLIYPHHGSRNNKIDVLVANRDSLGLDSVVISVNRQNRYLHPSPEILNKLLTEFGVDKVFITWSDTGDNVTVKPEGVSVEGGSEGNRARLMALVNARLDQTESRILNRLEKIPASVSIEEDSTIKRYRNAYIELMKAHRLLADSGQPERKELLAGPRGLDGNAGVGAGSRPEGGGPVNGGLSGGPGAALSAPTILGGGSGGGARSYGTRISVLSSRETVSGPGTSGSVSGGTDRVSRFEREIEGRPNWGGVVVGNRTDGPALADIEFFQTVDRDDDNGTAEVEVAIRVVTQSGEIADYFAVTPTELWAAYHYVQPNDDMVPETSTLDELQNAIGLVGLKRHVSLSRWEFYISPAISDTVLAQDGMRLDMFYAWYERVGVDSKSELISQISEPPRMFKTYQWFDDVVKLEPRLGLLHVGPAPDLASCVMRLRLWAPPGYASSEEELVQEFLKRHGAELAEMETGDQLNLLKAFATQVARDSSSSALNSDVDSLCRNFEPLARIDRFARVAAILNHFRDTSGKNLPPLPEWLKPNHVKVPPIWEMDHVVSLPAQQGATRQRQEPILEQKGPSIDQNHPTRSIWHNWQLQILLAAVVLALLAFVFLRMRSQAK